MMDGLSRNEQEDVVALIRSGVILTGVVTVPVGLVTGLFGPVLGLLALAGSIPISAHMGGLVSFGDSPEKAWARARADARVIGQVTGLATLFWFLIVYLIPEEVLQVPILSILISSLYTMTLYVIGMRGPRDEIMSGIGIPVVLIFIFAAFLI